jgi:light-regulated signal transduction histidine kinase (bacteriophytochrome)
MEQHARRLNEYAERLEYSNRELEEFAYVASHDLQEPLRKIEAFGDRLRQKYSDRLDENGRAYLERMQHASRRMRSLISDLLDYSRISTKTKPFAKVDMREVAEGVIADLEIALEASGAEVSVCDLPCLEADRPQMQRLFQNLIANAIKFAKPDVEARIEITVETERVDGAAPMCRLQVRDNGIGFDNRHAEQVFKIFHRLHGRSEYEGTGIGLATCRKIVERHSGTIAASSEPGVGTTITVRLPIHRPLQGGQL